MELKKLLIFIKLLREIKISKYQQAPYKNWCNLSWWSDVLLT